MANCPIPIADLSASCHQPFPSGVSLHEILSGERMWQRVKEVWGLEDALNAVVMALEWLGTPTALAAGEEQARRAAGLPAVRLSP